MLMTFFKTITNLNIMEKIFTLLVLVCNTINIMAQNCNELDPTFGISGKQIGLASSIWLTPRNIVVQPDNKIVQFGSISQNGSHFSIVRYNSNGSLDNSFGVSGVVITT